MYISLATPEKALYVCIFRQYVPFYLFTFVFLSEKYCKSLCLEDNSVLLNCQTVVLEKTLESPLDSKEMKPVNPTGNQP